MSDVREILERGLGGAAAPPDGFERMLRRRDRKRRNQRIRAGALGLLIVAAGLAVAVQVIRSDRPAEPTPAPEPTPTSDFDPSPSPPLDLEPLVRLDPGAYFVNALTGEAVPLPSDLTSVPGAGNYDVSPDGSMIAFDNAGDRPLAGGGLHQVYVANIDGTGLRRLTEHPIAAVEPAWSPDGTRIVYLAGRDPSRRWTRLPVELTVVDVATGATSIAFTDRAARDLAGPLAFTPDGSILFWRGHLGYGRRPWTVPVSGGRPEPFLDERGWYSGALSPDGSTFVLQRLSGYVWHNRGGTCSELWLTGADGSDPTRFTGCLDAEGGHDLASGAALSGGWSPDGRRVAYSVRGFFSATPARRVVIFDVEAGRSTVLANGYGLDWLDDETLIVMNQGPGGGS